MSKTSVLTALCVLRKLAVEVVLFPLLWAYRHTREFMDVGCAILVRTPESRREFFVLDVDAATAQRGVIERAMTAVLTALTLVASVLAAVAVLLSSEADMTGVVVLQVALAAMAAVLMPYLVFSALLALTALRVGLRLFVRHVQSLAAECKAPAHE